MINAAHELQDLLLNVIEYHNAQLLAVDIRIENTADDHKLWGVDAECKVIISKYPDTEIFDNGYDYIMDTLNIAYDPGFGIQHVHGTVWFENGIWATRHEYDGSEGWELHIYPKLPVLDTNPDQDERTRIEEGLDHKGN